MTAPLPELPEAADLYEVTEGTASYWHYHLSPRGSYTLSLCGRSTMQTSLPLAQFGIGKAAPESSILNGRWCKKCQQLRNDRDL